MTETPPAGATSTPAGDEDKTSRVLTGRTPDITAAQLVGVVGAVIAVAVSFGVNIAKEQQEAILALVAAVAAVLFAVDAHLRANRAHAEAVKSLVAQHSIDVHRAIDHHAKLSEAALGKGHAPPPLVLPAPPVPPSR